MFPDLQSEAQAVVKIVAGQEVGFGPMAAMQAVQMIQGRPTFSANALAALVKRHPAYNYRTREDPGDDLSQHDPHEHPGRDLPNADRGLRRRRCDLAGPLLAVEEAQPAEVGVPTGGVAGAWVGHRPAAAIDLGQHFESGGASGQRGRGGIACRPNPIRSTRPRCWPMRCRTFAASLAARACRP